MAMALSAVIGLISMGALHEGLFGEQLAVTRGLHQRALALAELGIEAGLDRLGTLVEPLPASFSLQPLEGTTDIVRVTLHPVASTAVPAGASAARLVLHHYEIRSTGHTARGTRAALAQGATRLFVAAEAGEDAVP